MKNKASKKNRKNTGFYKTRKSKNHKRKNKTTRNLRVSGGMENEENICPICPICLEQLDGSSEEYTLRECKHRFHKECMKTWCINKEDCSCPACRKDLKYIDLQELGVIHARSILLRRKIRWVEGYIQRIRDKLASNDIPPIPPGLQQQIPGYVEGGTKQRFWFMILILKEELYQELSPQHFDPTISFINDVASETSDSIDENVRYNDNDLYYPIKVILNEIVNELNIVT
jgi:hypothetical protein